MNVQDIPLALIDPSPFNPAGRVAESADLLALLESIRDQGLLTPIRVSREPKTGRYVIVAGHRRWWCKRRLEHADIACVVEDGPPAAGKLILDQIAENVHRLAFRPAELGRVIRRLQDEAKLTQKQVAERLHYSEALVSSHLSLLKLPEALQDAVDDGRLAASVAVLLAKADDPAVRDDLARRAMAGASRAEIAAAVAGTRPAARRRVLRAGPLAVTLSGSTPLPAVIRGLQELLKQARKAAADGRGLDALTATPEEPR